jgi:hypothetical protein
VTARNSKKADEQHAARDVQNGAGYCETEAPAKMMKEAGLPRTLPGMKTQEVDRVKGRYPDTRLAANQEPVIEA